MSKHIIAFMVLILLVIENNSIFKRLCVESLPSTRHDESIHLRQQSHHYHHDHQQQQQHLHRDSINSPQASHHHDRKVLHHTKPNHRQKSSSNAKHKSNRLVEGDSKMKRDEHAANILLRHRLQQIEHQMEEEHQEQYQRRTRSNTENKHLDIRTMPRPWAQLLLEDEIMFGDEPKESDEENMYPTLPKDENLRVQNPYQNIHDYNIGENYELNYDDRSDSVELPVQLSENHENTPNSGYRCPKCEIQQKVEHVTEEELTRLRIEFVKTQILEKLRLKERPNVSAVALPKPIQEGVTIDQGEENSKNKELDDYYARTSKKFIFLERETRECERTGIQPSICFSFKIDDADADGFDVSTAVLWIFTNKMRSKIQKPTAATNVLDNNNNSSNIIKNQETIVVSEVQQPVDLNLRPIVKTIAIQTVVDQDKWLEIDIEWPIKRWFGNHDLSHLIQISCESCDISAIEEMISVDKDYRPFIMIDTQNRRRASRQKRGINCTDGVTECCREKLYISFEEIGWGDWIIQPRGYDAYFCRGSCGSVASISQSSSHHSTFLQKFVAMNRNKGKNQLELIPCCTAKQYSSLQLVFMDSNNTATQKTFPNMVIESCGCR